MAVSLILKRQLTRYQGSNFFIIDRHQKAKRRLPIRHDFIMQYGRTQISTAAAKYRSSENENQLDETFMNPQF